MLPYCSGLGQSKVDLQKALIFFQLRYSIFKMLTIFEPVHEISNNVVCATSKASDQPALMRSLIRAFACRLNIL